MIPIPTEDELRIFETLSNPISFSEIMFDEPNNLSSFSENKLGDIRVYQYPFFSYDGMYCEDEKLTKKENFEQRRGMAEGYILGGRLSGKSHCAVILDNLYATWNKLYDWGVVESLDEDHIKNVMEKIVIALEGHPILKQLETYKNTQRKPYNIVANNGCHLESINDNLCGKQPGNHWTGRHVDRVWQEESSFVTKEVTNKKLMAQSELGMISRSCIKEGTKILMSDFTTKNIEDIKIGDKIISWNEENSELTISEVKNTWFTGVRDVIKIKDIKNELWLTPEHRIRCITEGDVKYSWREASGCISTKYYAKSFSCVGNVQDYLEGVLVGILESDGSHYKFERKDITYHQFIIHQSDEIDFIDWLLTTLKITYTKTEMKKHGWNKKQPYRYNIERKNNDFILSCYDKLLNNVDSDNGFLIGFIIGDGYTGDTGALMITQSYKTNNDKIILIEKILNKRNIKYCRNNRESHKSAQISISKYELSILDMPCKKIKRHINSILNIKRPVLNKYRIELKGFEEKQKVYDIETDTHSFIANGFIVHNSGMTTFSKVSPMGEIFYDLKNESKLCNVPSYINPSWDAQKEKAAQDEFGGKNSVGFSVQILGKVISNDESVFDMEEIRKTYIKDNPIKAFEINKNNFFRFKEILILEKPINAEKMLLCADTGEGSAPTEIIILSQTNKIYKYIYNVTAFKLSSEEQYELFEYLMELLNVDVVGLDQTSGMGKAIISHLAKKYADHLIPVSFNENIDIDFDRDENGKIIFDDRGNAQFKKDNMVSWSIQCLKKIFYNGKIKCLTDMKLDAQIDGVIAKPSSQGKILYGYKTANHIFQAFQVFAIVDFLTEFKNSKPIRANKTSFGSF